MPECRATRAASERTTPKHPDLNYLAPHTPDWDYVVATSYGSNIYWQAARNGQIPDGAVVGGNEPNGASLFICRAAFNGGVHPGKIRFGFQGCFIPYGGQEHRVSNYEVMVGYL